MEGPFFSLSKSKRMKPIEYVDENDGIFVNLQPHQDFGMATIWETNHISRHCANNLVSPSRLHTAWAFRSRRLQRDWLLLFAT